VTESLAAYPGARVKEVRLRVGALAAVIEDSLQFCYGIATEGTALEGSKLVVKMLPVVVHCGVRRGCGAGEPAELPLPALRRAVRRFAPGRELEIDSIEIEEARKKVSA
jgi:hydrogenase nickel incorporation protein HypA/HybF